MSIKRKVEDEEIRLITEVPTGTFIRAVVPKTGRIMNRVYILDGYDRSTRRYVAHAWDDINQEIYLTKTRQVLVGFTF